MRAEMFDHLFGADQDHPPVRSRRHNFLAHQRAAQSLDQVEARVDLVQHRGQEHQRRVQPVVGEVCRRERPGAAAAGLHAYASLRWRADQVVSGIALNLVALGLVTFLLEEIFGSSAMSAPAPALPRWAGHSPLSWIALAAPFAVHFVLYKTAWGLRVRAVGENPRAAAAAGIDVLRLRAICVVGSGALAGLGGAALSVAILDRFENRMPAGLGFMALAAVVFGKWTPLGAFAAALFFALADAVQRQLAIALHASDLHLAGLFLALPYALTLLLLGGFVGRATAPAADGVPYDPEAR